MNRRNCVVCENESMETIQSLLQYPLLRHSLEPFTNDKYSDLHYVKCVQCGCIQLYNLQDSNFLYKENNNQTYLTNRWNLHNDEFSSFILSDISSDSIFEIGGVNCHLANSILNKRKLKYTILDLCLANVDVSGIQFIYGNAEDYDFPSSDLMILSHVFEHLYNPRFFLKKLYDKKVKNIYISIPDMSTLLEKSIPLLINVEHTFYINSYLCKELFESMGYRCVKEKNFCNHSVFFHFTYDTPQRNNINLNLSDCYRIESYFKSYKPISLPENISEKVYIAPGGYYGQYLYYHIKEKERVQGFLDNDKQKEGWRIYGTPHLITHPSSLPKESHYTICLSSSLYTSEIISDFKRDISSCSIFLI